MTEASRKIGCAPEYVLNGQEYSVDMQSDFKTRCPVRANADIGLDEPKFEILGLGSNTTTQAQPSLKANVYDANGRALLKVCTTSICLSE